MVSKRFSMIPTSIKETKQLCLNFKVILWIDNTIFESSKDDKFQWPQVTCDHWNLWSYNFWSMTLSRHILINQASFVAFFYQRINFFCSFPIQCRSKRFSRISYLFFCSIALSKYLYVVLKRFWLCERFDRSYFGNTIKQWGYITPRKCMCKKYTSTKWLS